MIPEGGRQSSQRWQGFGLMRQTRPSSSTRTGVAFTGLRVRYEAMSQLRNAEWIDGVVRGMPEIELARLVMRRELKLSAGGFEPMYHHDLSRALVLKAQQIAFMNAHDQFRARLVLTPTTIMLRAICVEASRCFAMPSALDSLIDFDAEIVP